MNHTFFFSLLVSYSKQTVAQNNKEYKKKNPKFIFQKEEKKEM